MSGTHHPVTLKLRIDWSELDYFGHVNNVSFFKYIQAARVHYWEQIGLTALYEQTNNGPLLASCKCDFKMPLFYPGNVIIRSGISFIGTTSFGISHQLLNGHGAIAALADDVLVMYDFTKEEKIAFPQDLRNRVSELEGINF